MLHPLWKPGRLHVFLCRVAEQFQRREITRLIITVPPQHGKSVLFAQALLAWMLGHNPRLKIGIISYSDDRAIENSLRAKELVEHPVYASIFPEVGAIRGGVKFWENSKRGGVRAVGAQGSITGFSLDLAIVDDPIKNIEEAVNQSTLEKIWQNLGTAVMSRASPQFQVCMIMTRWDIGDPVGRATEEGFVSELRRIGGETYTVINLPAICDSDNDWLGRDIGERLWPERYDETHYKVQRLAFGPWADALLQGRPIQQGGHYVKEEDFVMVDAVPQRGTLRWCRGWDLATTTKTESDFTAGLLGCMDSQDNFYVADLKHGQWEWPVAKQIMCATAMADSLPVHIEENGAGKAATPDLRHELGGKVPVYGVNVHIDKLGRAVRWIAAAKAKKIFVLRADWNALFFREVTLFNKGPHDDIPDALSIVYNQLVGLHTASAPMACAPVNEPDSF